MEDSASDRVRARRGAHRASDKGPLAGTARLPVVTATALITFFQAGLLGYALPLYFSVCAMPSSAWETWGLYQILAWLFAPLLSWLLARRLGDRRVWALGLAVIAAILGWLIILPSVRLGTHAVIGAAGLLYGAASALVWTSGITLTQNVSQAQRGRANSLMMVSLGLGSIAGPLYGRLALAIPQNSDHAPLAGFFTLLITGALLSLLGGVLVYCWGEYPQAAGPQTERAAGFSLRDDLRLIRSADFLLLVVPLSLLAGPMFQATNVYLAYRVAEPGIGLIRQGQDHGWVALQVTSYAMQLLGGLLLGLVAGKRASKRVAAAFLATFTLCGIGIGLAPNATVIFGCVACFEVVRQFMRWLQTGYVSEYVPAEQRSAAISVAVMLSGLGASGFMLLSRLLQSPDSPSFSATLPFLIAAVIGLAGTAILACRRAGPRSAAPVIAAEATARDALPSTKEP